MRKINIPLGMTASIPFPLFGAPAVHEIATFDGETAAKELDTVKYNGGMFIWAASDIETKLNDFIVSAIFVKARNGAVSPQESFFQRHFLEASHLEFSGKLKIASELIEARCLLGKKEREEFEGKLRNIMRYRNAFAHGKLVYDTSKGCVLSYFTNGHKSDVIDNDFIGKLEDYYNIASEALRTLNKALAKPWPTSGIQFL